MMFSSADKHVLISRFDSQAYLKSHFNYNPNTDSLIPCKEAGLAFSKGDILQVVNKEDSNWWQVRCTSLLLKAQFGKKKDPDTCFGFCPGTQSHRRSHWSYPQSVLGGEEEGFCEKRLG